MDVAQRYSPARYAQGPGFHSSLMHSQKRGRQLLMEWFKWWQCLPSKCEVLSSNPNATKKERGCSK
jgi:hypothetical protein